LADSGARAWKMAVTAVRACVCACVCVCVCANTDLDIVNLNTIVRAYVHCRLALFTFPAI